MGFFSFVQEIAMDLGTANTIIISDDKIVVDEPSVVALDRHTDKMIAVGEKAKMMYEKTHDNIRTVRPLRDGVIADFSACEQMAKYEIPEIDLVIVDLYPFEQTVASGASEEDIIEKIDIGGISLIRAGAKNFNDVVIVPSKAEYGLLLDILNKQGAETTKAQRREFATRAFGVSSHYDTAIHAWFEKK